MGNCFEAQNANKENQLIIATVNKEGEGEKNVNLNRREEKMNRLKESGNLFKTFTTRDTFSNKVVGDSNKKEETAQNFFQTAPNLNKESFVISEDFSINNMNEQNEKEFIVAQDPPLVINDISAIEPVDNNNNNNITNLNSFFGVQQGIEDNKKNIKMINKKENIVSKYNYVFEEGRLSNKGKEKIKKGMKERRTKSKRISKIEK